MANAVKYQQDSNIAGNDPGLGHWSKLLPRVIALKDFSKWFIKSALLRTAAGRNFFDRRTINAEDKYYQEWVRRHTFSTEDLHALSLRSAEFKYRPVISIILPVYEPKIEWLEDAINSVCNQAYPYWELCIADDASPSRQVREVIEKYRLADSRIKVCFRPINGHISESSNSALELATGDFVALLDHDDVLAREALFEVASAINEDPSVDILYSNEDKINFANRRCQPTLKPQWSPEYFLSFMYIGHLSVYRHELVKKVGGFRKGLEGSQDYDLALRCVERTEKVRHIPKVLYHWRMHQDSVASNIHAKPYAFKAGKRALDEALLRRSENDSIVENGKLLGIYRVRRNLTKPASVCIVITSGSDDLPNDSVERILRDTSGSKIDLYLAGSSVSAKANYSQAVIFEGLQYAVRDRGWREAFHATKAEYILFIDAQTRPRSEGWFVELLSQAGRNGVGAVGPKFIDVEKNLFLNAGYSIAGTKVGSNFFDWPAANPGYAARSLCMNNVSVLSSRCILFPQCAMQDERALDHYESRTAQEVDLSLTLMKNERRLIFTPYAEMYLPHMAFEKCFDLSTFPSDLTRLAQRHGIGELIDPYFPRGLDAENVEFKFPFEA